MDREAWSAGVTKSQTRLSDWTELNFPLLCTTSCWKLLNAQCNPHLLCGAFSVCYKAAQKFFLLLRLSMAFPGGTSGKEPTCQCTRHKRHGFHPWVRKIPWRMEATVHRATKNWTQLTWLSTQAHVFPFSNILLIFHFVFHLWHLVDDLCVIDFLVIFICFFLIFLMSVYHVL